MTGRAGLMLAAVLLGMGVAGPAVGQREELPAETRMFPYSGVVPACADPWVTQTISDGFRSRERLYWQSELTITGIEDVRTTATRPNGLDLIPRRYCEARGLFSDGKQRTIAYSIAALGGFAGVPLTSGVEWCVEGLDRHNAFAPACRLARR